MGRSPLSLGRFVGFVREVYAPGLHLAFAAAWFFSLGSTLLTSAGSAQHLGITTESVIGVLSVLLILLFLRIVDEWKDLDYDRVHNPDRPLVRGAVEKRDLFVWLAIVAALTVGLQAHLGSIALALLVLAELAWSLALVLLERRSAVVRDNILVNLLVTYPVNVAVSVYGLFWVEARYGPIPFPRAALVVGAFALAFLSFELARKTAWPKAAKPGERLYSSMLGPRVSMGLVVVCGLLAIVLILASARPALADLTLVAPLVPLFVNAARFQRGRDRRVSLRFIAMVVLGAFYVALVVRAWLPR